MNSHGFYLGNDDLNPSGHLLGAQMATHVTKETVAEFLKIAPIISAKDDYQKQANYISSAFTKANAISEQFFNTKIGDSSSKTVAEFLKEKLNIGDDQLKQLKNAYAGAIATTLFIQGEGIGAVTIAHANDKLIGMLDKGDMGGFKKALTSGSEFSNLFDAATQYGTHTYRNSYVKSVTAYQNQVIFDFSLAQKNKNESEAKAKSQELVSQWQKVITAGGQYEVVTQKIDGKDAQFSGDEKTGNFNLIFKDKSSGQQYSFDITGSGDGGASAIAISRLRDDGKGGIILYGAPLLSRDISGYALDSNAKEKLVLTATGKPNIEISMDAVISAGEHAPSIGGNFVGVPVPNELVGRDSFGVPRELVASFGTLAPIGRALERREDGRYYYKSAQPDEIKTPEIKSPEAAVVFEGENKNVSVINNRLALVTERNADGSVKNAAPVAPGMLTKSQFDEISKQYVLVQDSSNIYHFLMRGRAPGANETVVAPEQVATIAFKPETAPPA